MTNLVKALTPIPWVPEAFHARFPVMTKSLFSTLETRKKNCHLVGAYGTVTGDKDKTSSCSHEDCEMRLTPDSFSFLKWRIVTHSNSFLSRLCDS